MPRDSFPTLKDGDPFPVNIAPPAAYVIDAANPNSPEVQDLLQRYEAEIRQYVEQQRRNYALSGLSQHKATYASADLDVTYLNQFGRERVTLTPRPTYPPPPAPVVPPRLPPRPVYVPGVKRVDVPIPIDYPCLLVLYSDPTGGDKYLAAIRMGDINPNTAECGAPWYIGALPNQTWGGKRFRVNQLNLDGTGAILTPIDFTADANPTADSLILYTPLLANGAVTTTESVQIPIMNGDASGKIYTALDVYQSAGGSFNYTGPGGSGAGTATLTNAEADPTTFQFPAGMPYCISPDGDYYAFPSWGALNFQVNIGLGYSYPYVPGPNNTPLPPTWADDYWYPAFAEPPNDYPVAGFKNFYYFSDAQNDMLPSGGGIAFQPQIWEPSGLFILEDWSGSSCSATIWVLTYNSILEGVYQTQQIPGYSLGSGEVAQSNPGGTISWLTYGAVGVAGWYIDPNNPQETWIQGDGSTDSFSGSLPYPQYQVPGGSSSDSLIAVMLAVNFTGSATLIHPGDGNEGGTASYAQNSVLAGQQSSEAQWITNLGDGNGPGTVVYGTQNPVNADSTYDGDSEDDLYFQQVEEDFTPTPPAGPGAYTVPASFVPWTYNEAQTTVGIWGIPVLGDPPGSIGVVAAVSFSASGGASSPTALFDAENSQMPQILTITGGDPSLTNTLSGTPTISLDINTFNLDFNGDAPMSLLIEPFPPSLSETQSGGGKFYYCVETDDTDGNFVSLAITTPFGTYTGMSQTSFDPWLHVSDGVYWAQGFAVDDVPYLFLNGQDFFSPLTKVLNCANTDIHALFMDVPLSVCMALGSVEVQPPLPDPSAPTYPTFWPRVQA